MKNEFTKKLVMKLTELGYGKIKNEKIELYEDKINIKIKEIKTLNICKDLYIAVNDRDYLISVLATLSISKDYNEFMKFLNNPKEMKEKVVFPEVSLRYIILNLFYDIDDVQQDKENYIFKPFEDIHEYINKYERINES